jgi:hypothetical protein
MSKIRALAGFLALSLGAAPLAAQNVLLFDDNSDDGAAADTLARMLTAGDIDAYEVVGVEEFGNRLLAGGWHLVLMDAPSNLPNLWAEELAQRVAGGSCAILSVWREQEALFLAPTFEVVIGAEISDATPLYAWNADPLFASPQGVPSPLADVDNVWGGDGFFLDPTGSAHAAGGFTAAPAAGQAAIVVGNGGRTIFNGFLFDDFGPANTDADAVDDVEELIENQVSQTLAAGCALAQPAPTQAIPTLGGWGLAAIGAALGGAGVLALRRRRAGA